MASLASASGSEGYSWLGGSQPQRISHTGGSGPSELPTARLFTFVYSRVVTGPRTMRGYVSVQMGPPPPGAHRQVAGRDSKQTDGQLNWRQGML